MSASATAQQSVPAGSKAGSFALNPFSSQSLFLLLLFSRETNGKGDKFYLALLPSYSSSSCPHFLSPTIPHPLSYPRLRGNVSRWMHLSAIYEFHKAVIIRCQALEIMMLKSYEQEILCSAQGGSFKHTDCVTVRECRIGIHWLWATFKKHSSYNIKGRQKVRIACILQPRQLKACTIISFLIPDFCNTLTAENISPLQRDSLFNLHLGAAG